MDNEDSGQNIEMSKVEKFYIYSILLLPILFQYATGIDGLTAGDALFVIAFFLYFIKKNPGKYAPFLVLFIYLSISTAVFYFSGIIVKITTSLHYMAYVLGMIFMLDLGKKNRIDIVQLYRKICKYSAILMIVQTIFYKGLGIVIPGIITFFPLTDPSLADYGSALATTNSGRCMSFFAEPSHFAIYTVPCLAILLFKGEKISKAEWIEIMLISLSLIFCASFTGIICGVFLWCYFLWKRTISGKFSGSMIFILVLVGIALSYIVFKTSAGSYFTNKEILERQAEGRFEGFAIKDFIKFNASAIIWGSGMNDIGEMLYLPGWPRLFYYFGIVGSSLYVICFIRFFKRNTFSGLILILMAILMVGTEMNFSSFIVPYVLLMFATKDRFIFKNEI